MFGLRLKSWMEAHLGRPRHKSTAHQNQKQQQQPKASKESSTSTSTVGATTNTSGGPTSIVLTGGGSSSTACLTFLQPHLHSSDKIGDSDRNSSSGLPTASVATTAEEITGSSSCSSSAALEVQSTANHQHLDSEQIHHLNQQQRHSSQIRVSQQLQPSTSSNSTNILLGSFSNNLSLSSPDTGYSTDGYSPKSVYPALSFESSGKSTPKSSYTISSLVSSERLHLNNSISCASSKSICTGGGPSKNSSISNGLELEEDVCDIPNGGDRTSIQSNAHSLLDPLLEIQDAKNISLEEDNDRSYQDGQSNHPAHTKSMDVKDHQEMCPALEKAMNGSSNPFSNSLNPNTKDCTASSSSSSSSSSSVPSSAVHPLLKSEPLVADGREELLSNSKVCASKGFPPPDKHDYFNHHRRTESMDEQRGRINFDESESNCSQVTGRSIRTSLLLTSQIPECYPGLTNAFSLCSPRRQRTRIKTNPWITFTENPDNNPVQLNYVLTNNSEANGCSSTNGPAIKAKGVNEIPGNPPPNSNTLMVTTTTTTAEDNINNKSDSEGGSSVGCTATESVNHAPGLFFRISTSTSASDSGKGTLEPGTNRNSTESSCLLSDSTSNSGSARNSIISPENEIKSGSLIIPNINTVHARLDQCVSNLSSVKTAVTKSSSAAAASSKGSGVVGVSNPTPSICISNSTKPSAKRLNSTSDSKTSSKLEGVVVAPCISVPPNSTSQELFTNRFGDFDGYPPHNNNMVDKETDILSDWANTDDDDGEGEEDEDDDDIENEEEEEEDEDNDNECITPTPSSPDVTFNNSSCSSSKLDYIQVSDHGGAGQSTKPNNGTVVLMGESGRHFQYQHQHNMNLPTTCYPSIPISSRSVNNRNPLHDATGCCDNLHVNQALDLSSHHVHDLALLTPPLLPASRCPNSSSSRITNSNTKPSNNPNTSQTIARGAIGFFRKMFKKGTCSSQKSFPSTTRKSKFLRSSRSNSTHEKDNNNIDNTIIPVGLLSPETVVVNNYPLSNTKPLSPAINGSFLTPTPNAFRRRNKDSSSDSTTDGKVSKHSHKAIKTDIIRLPAQPPSSSSSLQSSQSSAIIQTRQHHQSQSTASHGHGTHSSGGGDKAPYYCQQLNGEPNTNTNSTTGSSSAHSLSIMSTSTTSRSDHPHNPLTPLLSQHHDPSSHAYSNVPNEFHNPRQSPFMSVVSNDHTSSRHHTTASSNNRGGLLSTPILQSSHPGKVSQSQGAGGGGCSGVMMGREVVPPGMATPKVCSYDSPRLPSTSSSRINSPSFNNYSPIHRLVVTGGNHLLSRGGVPVLGPPPAPLSSFHPSNGAGTNNHHHPPHHSPAPLPRTTTNPQLINRPPTTTASPLINNRHSISNGSSQHPFVSCSPSPILRNPRYQYITSSNQNSPLLNIPKRLNVPFNPRGPTGISKSGPSQVVQPIFHSPSLSSASPSMLRAGNCSSSNNYPIPNHHPHGSPDPSCLSPRSGNFISHHRVHMQNTNNNNHNHNHMTNGGGFPDGPDAFHHPSHYYSSPITGDPKSQFYPLSRRLPPSRGAERIYESVDDSEEEEDEMRSDEGDGEGGDFEFEIPLEFKPEYPRRESDLIIRRGVFDSDSVVMGSPLLPHTHMNNKSSDCSLRAGECANSRWKSKSASKPEPRRSKTFSTNSTTTTATTTSTAPPPPLPPPSQQPPLPPRYLPMMLGTYLSETETRLLEADNDTDRKYKRLISEAEALLKEISIEKSQPSPWLSRYARESLRQDDCPQSDPLRRKAYDCWALRRLQQELAGCCASPPVLHRSRLHITSPVSPSPSQNRNLNLAQYQPDYFPFNPDRRSSISRTSGINPPPF